jgi:hypothetical protein
LRSERRRAVIRHARAHPIRLTLTVGDRLVERTRSRRLREHYDKRIADPSPGAVLRAPAIELASASDLPSELKEASGRILREAESVLSHRVDYLGSGLVQLGDEIDWQTDFKSGYRWPLSFYRDVEVTRLTDTSDAKVPWELSRGHQLLTLARAARIYEEERFAAELEAQLTDWMERNPPGQGINWVNPMEIAIRAVNWLWAIGTVEQWRPLDPSFREAVTRSLQVHGRHIAANLEGSRLLRSNHYLADVLGLLLLGAHLEGDPIAAKWFRFGRRQLEHEMFDQVLPDGVNFEASLPYHGLALEMFLLGWLVSQQAGRPLSNRYRDRLERMLDVARSVRHPIGRSPVFGDQDSGRILPAGFARPPTQDNLLDLGSAILDLPRLVPGPPHEEVAWILGIETWKRIAQREHVSTPPSAVFADGGLYVLRADNVHVVVRWGEVGQNGNGGHGHNDLSSYELSYGVPFVVDPGTFVYTADPAERDRFRSASAHNVVVVDGQNMHQISPQMPFEMPARARFGVEHWEDSTSAIVLTGWHDAYGSRKDPVVCRRTISLDKATGAVEVVDDVRGQGRRRIESLLHLASGVDVRTLSATDLQMRSDRYQMGISFTGAETVTVVDGWVSEQYGVRQRAAVLRATTEVQLPTSLRYRMTPQ